MYDAFEMIAVLLFKIRLLIYCSYFGVCFPTSHTIVILATSVIARFHCMIGLLIFLGALPVIVCVTKCLLNCKITRLYHGRHLLRDRLHLVPNTIQKMPLIT